MGIAASAETYKAGWLLSSKTVEKERKKAQPKSEPFLTERHSIYGGAAEVVRTRDSGEFWHFRMRIGSEGKYYRQSLRTKDLDIAAQRAEKLFIEISAKIQSGKKVFSPTVQQAVEEYLKHRWQDVERMAIVEDRWKTMRSQLKHFIEFAGVVGSRQNSNVVRLGDLDRKSLNGYQRYRQEQGVTATTIRNEQSTINALCKWAFEEGLHSTSNFIFPAISNKGVDPDSIRRSTFTDEEYKRITRVLISYTAKKTARAEKLDEETLFNRQLVRHYFFIGANTMMRSGELRQLRWGDVETYDLGNQRLAKIVVRAETSKVRKARIIAVRGGKHFDRLKKLSRHTKPTDLVFSDHEGKEIGRKMRYAAYAKIMDLAGIPNWKERRLTYYSTRHYGITKRLQNGANPVTLSKAAGTSLKHLTETYFHANLKDQERAALAHYVDNSDVVRLD